MQIEYGPFFQSQQQKPSYGKPGQQKCPRCPIALSSHRGLSSENRLIHHRRQRLFTRLRVEAGQSPSWDALSQMFQNIAANFQQPADQQSMAASLTVDQLSFQPPGRPLLNLIAS